MVARPPVALSIERMTVDDLRDVEEIERESFTTPWPPHAYRSELETNRLAFYVVARHGERVVGFAGLWMMVDEAHITTFAVRRTWRRQGVGDRLLIALLDYAVARKAHEATLEVRPSNHPARRLYEKFGFELVGLRPRYYSDDNEDALIMTTRSLESRQMKELIARLREETARRPEIELGDDGLPVARAADTDTDSTAGAPEGSRAVAPDVLRPSRVRKSS
jgi:ribosomal-protein-alanine N-acetyltransferase